MNKQILKKYIESVIIKATWSNQITLQECIVQTSQIEEEEEEEEEEGEEEEMSFSNGTD